MPQHVDKNRLRQSAGPARNPVMAFMEDSIITPVKNRIHHEVHDKGERFYDAERYKANLLNKSAAQLQDKKQRIETTIAENYVRAGSTVAAVGTRLHALPHSPNTYTTMPKAVVTTVRSASIVTKKASHLLHVRDRLAHKGEPMSWWAWKDTPRAAWRGMTGGTTFVKAGIQEFADQNCPIPTGAYYADDPYPSNVLQAREKGVKAAYEVVDAYDDMKKLLGEVCVQLLQESC